MKRKAEVIVTVPTDSILLVRFRRVEVSLDCGYCRRTARTVSFNVVDGSAQCFPGSAKRPYIPHPPFPGRATLEWSGGSGSPIVGRYRLEYEMAEPFIDSKYGLGVRNWTGYPTWGRVEFTLNCRHCRRGTRLKVQSNTAHPRTHHCHHCDRKLLTTDKEMLSLRWLDPDTGKWFAYSERARTNEEVGADDV